MPQLAEIGGDQRVRGRDRRIRNARVHRAQAEQRVLDFVAGRAWRSAGRAESGRSSSACAMLRAAARVCGVGARAPFAASSRCAKKNAIGSRARPSNPASRSADRDKLPADRWTGRRSSRRAQLFALPSSDRSERHEPSRARFAIIERCEGFAALRQRFSSGAGSHNSPNRSWNSRTRCIHVLQARPCPRTTWVRRDSAGKP